MIFSDSKGQGVIHNVNFSKRPQNNYKNAPKMQNYTYNAFKQHYRSTTTQYIGLNVLMSDLHFIIKVLLRHLWMSSALIGCSVLGLIQNAA